MSECRLLGYLHGTRNFDITYGTNSDGLMGWPDSDFMSDSRDTRSKTGMVFTLYGGTISWQSCLQPTIARSMCEAEHMVANAACRGDVAL